MLHVDGGPPPLTSHDGDRWHSQTLIDDLPLYDDDGAPAALPRPPDVTLDSLNSNHGYVPS
jgi:hypothetical protein